MRYLLNIPLYVAIFTISLSPLAPAFAQEASGEGRRGREGRPDRSGDGNPDRPQRPDIEGDSQPDGGDRPRRPMPPVDPTPEPTPIPMPQPEPPTPSAPSVDRPRPMPMPAPTPVAPTPPAPTPPAPTGPSQTEIEAAHALGVQDGRMKAKADAIPKGTQEGRQNGAREGRSEGFERCEKIERQRAHADGYQRGFERGRVEGREDGFHVGTKEGRERGGSEGYADGKSRADQDAKTHATAPATAEGEYDADRSDARPKGEQDGIVAGDRNARETADRVDYARGRKHYRDSRWAEKVENEDTFAQREQQTNGRKSSFTFAQMNGRVKEMLAAAQAWKNGMGSLATNRDGGRSFPSTQENAAYSQGYQSGYADEYQREYGRTYRREYNESKARGERDGCEEARRRDYRFAEREGIRQGRDEGYADAFERARRRAFKESYDVSFADSSRSSYESHYQVFYRDHFSRIRARAYEAAYNTLYNQAHRAAKEARYREVYPEYARLAFSRGVADETEDFQLRPVRLLEAEATETIRNGLYEPGEAVRLRIKLRSFSGDSLLGRDIKVVVKEITNGSSVISEGEALLARDLKAKSSTQVSEILELYMNHSSVNQKRDFQVKAFYQGREVGEKIISITSRYMVDVKFASAPKLLEGMKAKLAIKVKNQSNQPTDETALLKVNANTSELELLKKEISIGVLQPGQERVIEVEAIGRSRKAVLELPIILEVRFGAGRRVGLQDAKTTVEMVNDYRIMADTNAVAALKKKGLVRLNYSIKNVGSKNALKGLQLKVSFTNPDGFRVIGPNPQFVSPLRNGQSLKFTVPVLVKDNNGGGTVELEVQENGRTTVINRNQF